MAITTTFSNLLKKALAQANGSVPELPDSLSMCPVPILSSSGRLETQVADETVVRIFYRGAVWERTATGMTPLTCPRTCRANSAESFRLEKQVLRGIHEVRARRTLPPLEVDILLSDCARGKCRRIQDFFDNLGYTWSDLLFILGIPSKSVGAAIGYGSTVEEVVDETRAMALHASWTSCGVGCGRFQDGAPITVLLFNEDPRE